MTSFVLTVAITVWSLTETHDHALHHALHTGHVALATLTFLLISLYLLLSAELASLMLHREMTVRMTVDPGASFAEHIKKGTILFNACAGALAKNGVLVNSARSLSSLAKQNVIAAAGNSTAREGYSVTKSTFEQIGVRLSDDVDACGVRIILGGSDPEIVSSADFIVTSDKITHVLLVYYISRIFVRYVLYNRVLMVLALLAAAALIFFGQIVYSAAVVALFSACEVILVRQIEKRTTRVSFAMITDFMKNRKERR